LQSLVKGLRKCTGSQIVKDLEFLWEKANFCLTMNPLNTMSVKKCWCLTHSVIRKDISASHIYIPSTY